VRKKCYKILASVLIFSFWLMYVPGLWLPAPAYALNEKITTAIVGIDCPTELDLPVRMYEAVSAAMVKSHRFEVTDSQQVASTLKDMGLEDVSLNMTQALDVSKALGVDTITMVQGFGIDSDNEKCYITIATQVIDVQSGIIIQSAFAVGEGYKDIKFELTDEAIKNAAQSVVNQMNDNLSKVGLIAIIKDGEIRINIGGDIGLKDNSEFVVYRDNKVIGKLKTRELDSYDAGVEKVIVLPGYSLQEGDIVVTASNQGDEIDRIHSPETLREGSSKVGLILLAILVGVAIALIATNESDQVQQQPASGDHGGYVLVSNQPLSNTSWVVTINVYNKNGQPVADGELYTPETVSNTAFDAAPGSGDAPLMYRAQGGQVKFTVFATDTAVGDNKTCSYRLKDSHGNYSQTFIITYDVPTP